MVAPNGARRNKSSHPALPITVDELVATCRSCAEAGAGGVHAHIRDENGLHSLDAGLYKAVIEKLQSELPGWFVQVTSETAGRFTDADQRELLHILRPRSVSVALREFLPDTSTFKA
ncbi:MAG: 3-keto-5-aminohexanoate cleavage protein, partial [Roseibium sp.]|nr:3-keto-5-aminohexanoate cleavage protein [Roseibium sp.]